MNNTSYRSAWALTILALLFERPMHPYEIRRLVRQRGKGDLVDLRPGSLYRTIERLEKAGLVEPLETTREGRFPERTVYRLTENGREELEEWLRELVSTPLKDFPQLVQALAVLPILEPDDVRVQLESRVVRLESEIAASDTMLRRLEGVLPRLFVLEGEYARALRRAELAWVRGLLDDIVAGRLAWSHEQLQAEYGGMETGRRPLELSLVDEPEEGEHMA
jgi:DNA-binding PadR family transcriptional regulator